MTLDNIPVITVGICENCKKEKEGDKVKEIEGHILCEACAEEIVTCDFCGKFLGISYDDLTENNFGRLSVPELSLPDMITNVRFCNIDHLEKYLEKRNGKSAEHICRCPKYYAV